MIIKNTTIQNRSKRERLDTQHIIPSHGITQKEVIPFLESVIKLKRPLDEILFTIGKELIGDNSNPAVERFLREYDVETVEIPKVPREQFDLLGITYQYLSSKTENLARGSFYTGPATAKDFVADLTFDNAEKIFDPSCGSGAFLFASDAKPQQLYGVDQDPTAIMIAKFNYFIKFPKAGDPNLVCQDFFSWFSNNNKQKFDFVIGNPPYGANVDVSKFGSLHVTSGESFSYFIEYGFNLVSDAGLLRFLLPESILNIKRHTDIRNFILEHTNLTRIKKYKNRFAGLMSDLYMLELKHGQTETLTFENGSVTRIPKSIFFGMKNRIFVHLTKEDISIISKVDNLKAYDLSESIFGLGVVTGDNKSKLLLTQEADAEPILSGKEVERYRLLPPRQFLIFDRNNLQQVAPDNIYRAPEKLVYKVINKYLRVAIDTQGRLTTNSANLIIPNIPELNIYCVMAFLNSDLYSFLHLKLFGGVNKIAKENLQALPLPELTITQHQKLENLARKASINGEDEEIQKFINLEVFRLTDDEVQYLQRQVPRLSV